ncbi:MAG: M20/M25/M40 family metallo-hydrolase [Anaerolineae bacterium]|nr:M20/M25/M40 family metallo-hydrolase [Anaerolineae bacterium]
MNRFYHIAEDSRVQAALRTFHLQQQKQLELILQVQQIPAPTFAEGRRADFVQAQFAALGLCDVAQDDLHNVYGRLPGERSGSSVIVSAHLDTVFPVETDLAVVRNGRYLYGPGIGDNSTGVAGLILMAQALRENQLTLPCDVWFVANVCEEGLGNLRGITAVVDRFGAEVTYIVVEGGLFGQVCHQAIGVSRFRVSVKGTGGHSWGSFGTPNAIHVLSRIVTAIDDLTVPEVPRTTYNVGTITGGTSINTIAQTASLELDLRSENVQVLDKLVNDVRRIVAEVAQRFAADGVEISMDLIGQRPAGAIPRENELVNHAIDALEYVGFRNINFMIGSTDANVPLSRGITAVCIGLTESANAHRTDEYIDPIHLPDGLSQLLLLILAAAGFE